VTGGPVGAAVGAAVGIALGTVAESAKRLNERMQVLEQSTRKLIEQYKRFDPIIARLNHQWELLDRRLKRAWSQTIAPILSKLTDIGTEFREKWERMKIDFFQAIEPYLKRTLDIFQKLGRSSLWLFDKLLGAITSIINGFTRLAKILHIPIGGDADRQPTGVFTPMPIEWPSVEGPLTGAMRRVGLTGLPFTSERRDMSTQKQTQPNEADTLLKQGLLEGQPGSSPVDRLRELPNLNFNIKVGDSKELSAQFESIWRKTAYELRKIEAEVSYRAFEMQSQGTYV
ncbi:hypothetical protein LCGC14_2174190, partial [marine sediment metagenome]